MVTQHYTWSTMVQNTVSKLGFQRRKGLKSQVPFSIVYFETQDLSSLTIAGNLITSHLRTWCKTLKYHSTYHCCLCSHPIVIGWEDKQVLLKNGSTYLRTHPSCLVLYPKTFSSSSEDSKIEIHRRGLMNYWNYQFLKILKWMKISEPPKQNSTAKKIELLKPEETIK